MKPRSLLDPSYLPRATLFLLLWGIGIWERLLGRKRARKLILGGMAASAVLVVILEARGGF